MVISPKMAIDMEAESIEVPTMYLLRKYIFVGLVCRYQNYIFDKNSLWKSDMSFLLI